MNGAAVLTMNSIPRVVMKDGTPNRSVMKAFTSPTPMAMAKARRIASGSGTPAANANAMANGAATYTDPTDRSNSPAIINSPTPSATMPNVGIARSTSDRLPRYRKKNRSGRSKPATIQATSRPKNTTATGPAGCRRSRVIQLIGW